MEQEPLASVLILPDIGAFWPGRDTPTWTVAGISALQQWFGEGDQLIYVASPDFTIDELTTDKSGFNHAWTHWNHQQSRGESMSGVLVVHHGLRSTSVHNFGPQVIPVNRQISVLIADKEDFDSCRGVSQQLSLMWRSLLHGYFDVTRWRRKSMLMGNLSQTVTAEKLSRVVVLDEIQGKLVPTIVTVPATA